MKFRYELDITPSNSTINHQSNLFLIGSCFTENINEKLQQLKFNTFINPNGILFNPVSVSEALINVIENKVYTDGDLFELNEAWHSWQHHSNFSGVSKTEALDKINNSTAQAHEYLKKATHLIITLGSAWMYTLTSKALNAQVGTVAANNHKAPHDWFEKKLLTPDQIILVLGTMLNKLGNFNPNIEVIFTISPVRHLREGLINNNRSKASLILAIHDMIDKLPKLQYFPSYELVIDDLRDYRFFAEDLAHPNYAATNYVWEKFCASYLSKATQEVLPQFKEIYLALNHKPFNPNSNAHQQFIINTIQKIKALQNAFPYLDFSNELDFFNA
jgi:hypothetical protein